MAATRRLWLAGAGAALLSRPAFAAPDAFASQRRRMVDDVIQLIAAGALPGVERIDPRVLDVMRRTPRHRFVPAAVQAQAYGPEALAIGHGATISAPLIVAAMTTLLQPRADHRVLEVGAGSGYQAAVLSPLVRHVYTVEIVAPLATEARARLAGMGYRNVTVRAGDGYLGWPEHAPFDRILVTAGATHIPQPLVRQLKPGGRMVIPLGRTQSEQRLVLVSKDAAGRPSTQRLARVIFVPLVESARPR